MLKVHKLLSHLMIILGGMFLTFFWLDRVNPAMCFIDNEISKWLLLCFSLIALTSAIITLTILHRQDLQRTMRKKRDDADGSGNRHMDE